MQQAASYINAAARSPIAWVELTEHRAFLVNFARRRLFDATLAEDAVHDVFEAVMVGRARFGAQSALRTWLTGILKNKIVDVAREHANHYSLDTGPQSDDSAPPMAEALASPQPGPDEQAEQRQRLRSTLSRIEALPDGLRKVIELRVLNDLSTEDVCRRLTISENNFFVRLHRARRQLL